MYHPDYKATKFYGILMIKRSDPAKIARGHYFSCPHKGLEKDTATLFIHIHTRKIDVLVFNNLNADCLEAIR